MTDTYYPDFIMVLRRAAAVEVAGKMKMP